MRTGYVEQNLRSLVLGGRGWWGGVLRERNIFRLSGYYGAWRRTSQCRTHKLCWAIREGAVLAAIPVSRTRLRIVWHSGRRVRGVERENVENE